MATSKLLSVFWQIGWCNVDSDTFARELKPAFAKIARTCYFALFTDLLAEPTITIASRLFDVWHSIPTRMPRTHQSAMPMYRLQSCAVLSRRKPSCQICEDRKGQQRAMK